MFILPFLECIRCIMINNKLTI